MGKAPRASKVPKAAAVVRSVDPKVVEFLEVASAGDVSKVKKIIKAAKFEIDEDVDKVTALMKACENGHVPVIEELLVAGAGMWCEGPTDDPMTPFMWAAHHGQLEVVRYFIEDVGMDMVGMNKAAGKSGRKTAMDYALDAGMHDETIAVKKFAVLGYLSEKGATYGEGVTDPQSVFDAAARGNVDYVHYCLEANGDMINSKHGIERSSLLHVAGNNGDLLLMRNLISHGADMEARDIVDRTPIMSAAIAGQVDAVRHLMKQDVTLESRDATGNTALHHACEMGHLDTVRALMSRDVPRVRTGDVNAETITEAMLEGYATEHQPPPRKLAPCELLMMKNKSGHTPVMKSFAGGVHVGVIRYVVGSMDGNIDPIKAGMLDADSPPVLARQLSTDGIALVPPDPTLQEDEGKGGLLSGVCGVADDAAGDKENLGARDGVEEFKEAGDRDIFYAEGTGPFPVEISPGPPTLGHRRMTRFVDTMKCSVWGFDTNEVMVMPKPAVLSQTRIVSFDEAKEKRLLTSLSHVPPRATLLYVSHRWAGPGQADSEDQSMWMQLKRYLEEPAGAGIHYVWIDTSCMDVGDKKNVAYDQWMNSVIIAIARSTHLLAVPPCKILDPRALVRDMAVAKMAERYQMEPQAELSRVPTAVSLKEQQHMIQSQNLRGFDVPDLQLNGLNNGSLAGVGGRSTTARAAKRAAAAERVVTEAVDAAILSRKASEPDKWAMIQTEALHPANDTAVAAGGVGDAAGQGSSKGGGSRARKLPVSAAGDVAGVSGKTESGASAPRKSTGSDSKVGSGLAKQSFSSKIGGKSKAAEAAAAAAAAAEASTIAGLTKKERRALEEQQAKEHAAAVAEQATAEVSMNSTLLAEDVHYSDAVALLNRGWVEMEVSMALIFGVQVQVCVRWGPKVSFQTVLVRDVLSADGELVEQAPGFKGAFSHAIPPLSPSVEESKGVWAVFKRTVWGSEPLPDLGAPLTVTYMPMLDRCHEPQTVVPPLVRAALALHDERTLLPFVAGELEPVQVMYKLSGLALQDVKDGFAGIGPMSDEGDRITIVRLYLLGLSYAMGIVPKGGAVVGKPKWQVQKDHKEAEQRVRELEEEIAMMKNKDAAESSEERELPPKTNLPADTGGCNCVVM